MISGSVVEVRVEPVGSHLAEDVVAGATTLTVSDPTAFDRFGGQVWIAGQVYEWVSVVEESDPVDPTTTRGVMTLSAGLADALSASEPVSLWLGTQVADDVILVVDIGGDDPIDVQLGSRDRKDWTALEGAVEPPIAVTLSSDLTALLDAPGYTPRLDPELIGVPTMYYLGTPEITVTSTTSIPIGNLETTLSSPGTTAVWEVEINADVRIDAGGTQNVIEPVINGDLLTPVVQLVTSGPTGLRVSGTRSWRVSGLPVGDHTLGVVTRNTAIDSAALVRAFTTMAVTRVR